MPIYVLEEKSGFWGRFIELYWLGVMFIGYPFVAIFDWVHWEIYGKGPRKK